MILKKLLAILAALCLLVCLDSPVLHFLGHIGRATFHTLFLAASIGWFVSAGLWNTVRNRKEG